MLSCKLSPGHLCQTWLITVFCLSSAVLLSPANAAESSEEEVVPSNVTDVTLYRSQALVTRAVGIDGAIGAKEFVIGDLPENIDPTSLFAEGNDGVEVRAVQFRTRAVGDSPREEVRNLEAEARAIEQKIQLNQKQTGLLQKRSKYLDRLEAFTPPTADFDLGRGVLDAPTLEQVTAFSFKQREEIAEAEVKLTSELYELQQDLNLSQRKMQEITRGSRKSLREAVLFVQKTKAGPQEIRLNYITNACGWSPTYTVRAESGVDSVRVEYNGLIQQMSGEDWKNVKLTLSTASPALSAAGPGLAPFRLTLQSTMPMQQAQAMNSRGGAGMGGPGGQVFLMGKSKDIKSLLKAQTEAISQNRQAVSLIDNAKTAWTINNVVNNFDCLAITSDLPASGLAYGDSNEGGEQPALSYTIESPVSLPSRNSQQMVRVLATDLESEFYYVATPVLTSYVYREAELNNNSQDDLLAGPITVYLDGRFVGRGEIPTVARGQTFVVGMGADSQLRSRRELAKKKNSINGGNRETKLSYKLVIENYKDTPASIRVVDRMPIIDDESNIRVTLAEGINDEISKDGVYVRMEYPKGILRWDAEVEGRSIGEKAHEIDYSYTLEHDRKYAVSLPGNFEEQEKEYNDMENSRNKR